MNAPLVSCPFAVIRFGWVQQQTHPKRMTVNGQLTRGAFIINDFLRNPHFDKIRIPPYSFIFTSPFIQAYTFIREVRVKGSMLQFNFFSALWPKDAFQTQPMVFFQDVIIFFSKTFLLLQNSNAKDEHHHEPTLKLRV